MILDGQTLALAPGIEDLKRGDDGHAVKSELHQSVLEIATEPAATVKDAGAQLRGLREMVRERAADQGLRVAVEDHQLLLDADRVAASPWLELVLPRYRVSHGHRRS